MTEKEFALAVRGAGGRLYLVGGYVRDMMRQAGPKDKDYMVSGLSEAAFAALFPHARKVGKSFPVYLLEVDCKSCEVAFARKERKTGRGYRGFEVAYDPAVTVEDDLFRRDTTMNSLALELPEQRLIDLYGGQEDIRQKRIRAVSRHFCEDPVRALRAARQAAELGFEITAETYKLMRDCAGELAAEPPERLQKELERALAAPRPSLFFRALAQAQLLAQTFPEIAALRGKSQPQAFHPEGDAYEHTLLVLDEVAAETRSLRARFAGLTHDLGKGTTLPEMLPHHYGHEKRGLAVLEKWNERMTLPGEWLKAARFVISQHMRVPRMQKPGKMAEILLSLHKSGLTMAEFSAVIRADSHGLPFYLEHGEELLQAMLTISGGEAPQGLQGPSIGEWLRLQRIKAFQQACAAIAAKSYEGGEIKHAK